MRRLHKAYDPHLAACSLAFAALFAFGLGLGQSPSPRGRAKWGINLTFGGQGWFGEAPERSFSLVSQTSTRARFVHHTRSKGRRQGSSLPLNVHPYIPVGSTLFVLFAAVCVRAPRYKFLI
jgi:hypothetical protein